MNRFTLLLVFGRDSSFCQKIVSLLSWYFSIFDHVEEYQIFGNQNYQTPLQIIIKIFMHQRNTQSISPFTDYLQNQQEGFAHDEVQSLIIPKNQINQSYSTGIVRPRKIRYRQPKLKLTFLGNSEVNNNEHIKKSIIKKQQQKTHYRSLDMKKHQRHESSSDLLSQCLTKIKRTVVGDNIGIPSFCFNQSKQTKSYIMNSGQSLVYEHYRENNTHGFIKTIVKDQNSFIQTKINKLLKSKIQESFILPRRQPIKRQNQIEFQASMESANLQFASKVAQNQYDLYIKNDTNTHGHQCWFYFRVKNNGNQAKTIFNVCNIKRDLKMFNEGQKIFCRKIGQKNSPWKAAGENISFKINNNSKISLTRVFKLTFELTLEANCNCEVSLVPPYSYSQLLDDLKQIQISPYVKIETLTYSLSGIAIPLVTFADHSTELIHKYVTFVNCRIHPGETMSSYVARGFMRCMANMKQQSFLKQFFQKNVVKIVPMVNPDGVIFGNFRTNFLGIDMNRNFDCNDQVINPQIVALKEYGQRLKKQHGPKFNLFLDLHGHSLQKNIFSYGPDYQTTQTNYYQIRLLPKILNAKSKYFKYCQSTFKLEDYKKETARGFFLNKININAFTIEASFGLFIEDHKNVNFEMQDWQTFGYHLAEGVSVLSKSRYSLIKSRNDIKKILSESERQQLQMLKKFKKQFKKQKEQGPKVIIKKNENEDSDSDGEPQCQDLSHNQREEINRRVVQNSMPNIILPRVVKKSIVYPTVSPKLFKISEDNEIKNQLKVIYTKRSKFQSLRLQCNGYLHSMKPSQLMKPDIKNIFPQ